MPENSFDPHPLLRNGHLMTVASNFWPRSFALPPPEERLFLVAEESRILGHCHWQPGPRANSPALVLVHGLEGSSDSGYMLGIAEKAFALGFHAIRLNQRNCGGTERLTPTLYNSGLSGDYRAVLEDLIQRDGISQLFFAGYSMGGNLVLKMAGELSSSAPAALRGVAAVCPALDLAACADALEKPENFFYQRHFVRKLLQRYAVKSALFPALYSPNGFGPIRTVRQFDDAITAPHFGFRDAQDYYQHSSASNVVPNIRVPTLVLTAQDDPFIPCAPFLSCGIPQNSAITFEAPARGGHCAFLSSHPGSRRFWAEQRILSFFQSLLASA